MNIADETRDAVFKIAKAAINASVKEWSKSSPLVSRCWAIPNYGTSMVRTLSCIFDFILIYVEQYMITSKSLSSLK